MADELPKNKSPLPKVAASSLLSGSTAGLIAWLWNGYVAEPQMPAEVAAILAGLAGPVVAYLVSWLPSPPRHTIGATLMLLAVSTLGACAPLGPQSAAGLTSAHVQAEEYDATGTIVLKRCEATVRDGKERGDVVMSGTVCGSGFTYVASEVKAFRAFEIRAEVEKASIDALGRVVPEVVQAGMSAALSAYTGTAVVGAARDAVAAKAALEAARLKIEATKAAAARQ